MNILFMMLIRLKWNIYLDANLIIKKDIIELFSIKR